VFAGQREGKVVFEVFPEPIHAIVAIETGITICKRMREGKDRVHLTVAGLAGVRSEGGYIAAMTVITREWFARRGKPVTG